MRINRDMKAGSAPSIVPPWPASKELQPALSQRLRRDTWALQVRSTGDGKVQVLRRTKPIGSTVEGRRMLIVERCCVKDGSRSPSHLKVKLRAQWGQNWACGRELRAAQAASVASKAFKGWANKRCPSGIDSTIACVFGTAAA